MHIKKLQYKENNYGAPVPLYIMTPKRGKLEKPNSYTKKWKKRIISNHHFKK